MSPCGSIFTICQHSKVNLQSQGSSVLKSLLGIVAQHRESDEYLPTRRWLQANRAASETPSPQRRSGRANDEAPCKPLDFCPHAVGRDCVIWPRHGPFRRELPGTVFAAHLAARNPRSSTLYPPTSDDSDNVGSRLISHKRTSRLRPPNARPERAVCLHHRR